ncbi:hypothetical protein ACXR2T_12040 [Leucobacter sp. HY1910]
MILEWLIEMAVGLWKFLAGLFPDWTLPPELASADGMLGQLFAFGQGLEPWANWPLLATLGAIPPAVWIIGVMIKAVRLLIGHVPFIGGNG